MDRIVNTTSLIKDVFDNKRNLVIIGLCGKKGSGCSTAAAVLNMEFEELFLECQIDFCVNNFFAQEEYEILYKFAKKNWHSFEIVNTNALITASVLQFCPEKFSEFLFNIPQEKKVPLNEYKIICKHFLVEDYI